MKNPRRMIGVFVAAAFAWFALPAHGWAQQSQPPQAQAGKMYQVGMVLAGECKFTDHVEIATRYQRWFQNAWSNAESLPTQGRLVCVQKLTEAGMWRMRVFDPDGDKTIKIVGPFLVTDQPCEGDQTKVASVQTPNGGTSGLEGLQGQQLFPFQTLTTEADVSLDFADGSRVNISKGSSFQLDGCAQYQAPDAPPMMKFSLFLGKIWSKIAPHRETIEISTERVVIGNRGTTFSVMYEKTGQITTVRVEEGSVWMRKLSGGPTVIVNAGQTGIQRGDDPPVVKGSPIGTTSPIDDNRRNP